MMTNPHESPAAAPMPLESAVNNPGCASPTNEIDGRHIDDPRLSVIAARERKLRRATRFIRHLEIHLRR